MKNVLSFSTHKIETKPVHEMQSEKTDASLEFIWLLE